VRTVLGHVEEEVFAIMSAAVREVIESAEVRTLDRTIQELANVLARSRS
jgi:hypothetical protein